MVTLALSKNDLRGVPRLHSVVPFKEHPVFDKPFLGFLGFDLQEIRRAAKQVDPHAPLFFVAMADEPMFKAVRAFYVPEAIVSMALRATTPLLRISKACKTKLIDLSHEAIAFYPNRPNRPRVQADPGPWLGSRSNQSAA